MIFLVVLILCFAVLSIRRFKYKNENYILEFLLGMMILVCGSYIAGRIII